jgi:hypothetical protein
MTNSLRLTQGYDDALANQIRATSPGMAHWAGSGPADTWCSSCWFFGYYKNTHNSAGEIITSKFRRLGCGKYHELTGRHGPDIDGNPKSCRHYTPRPTPGGS